MPDNTIITEKTTERYILIAVDTKNAPEETDYSLRELAALTQTLGAAVAGVLTQNLERIHPAHYFGSGKLEELSELISETGANGVICDDELTVAQYRNMEKSLGVKILDRTTVILDIFAKNAGTAEAIAQVELAQQSYRLTKLAGLGKSLSRLGGGIGTRGPGEKKLETDRRHIRERISQLNEEIKKIEQRRAVSRNKREKAHIPAAALVGYTNAGKSTIMNLFTNADVLAEDKLFATLDTTTRLLKTPSGSEFLLSDTVGFIQKLPHGLIKAFRATLDELKYADILLHVVDSSGEFYLSQMETVKDTLRALGLYTKPIITVFNKTDIAAPSLRITDDTADYTTAMCAITGEGKDELISIIEDCIRALKTEINALIPYSRSALVNLIHKKGEVISETYEEKGTRIHAYVPPDLAAQLQPDPGGEIP